MVYVTLQPTINFRVILLSTLHRVVQNHWTGKKPALVFYFLIFIALPGRKTNWFSRVIVHGSDIKKQISNSAPESTKCQENLLSSRGMTRNGRIINQISHLLACWYVGCGVLC